MSSHMAPNRAAEATPIVGAVVPLGPIELTMTTAVKNSTHASHHH